MLFWIIDDDKAWTEKLQSAIYKECRTRESILDIDIKVFHSSIECARHLKNGDMTLPTCAVIDANLGDGEIEGEQIAQHLRKLAPNIGICAVSNEPRSALRQRFKNNLDPSAAPFICEKSSSLEEIAETIVNSACMHHKLIRTDKRNREQRAQEFVACSIGCSTEEAKLLLQRIIDDPEVDAAHLPSVDLHGVNDTHIHRIVSHLARTDIMINRLRSAWTTMQYRNKS